MYINRISTVSLLCLIYISALLAFSALIPVFPALAATDTVDITQQVVEVCGNGVCEAGEDVISCPADCKIASPSQPKFDIFPPRITDIVVQPGYNYAIISWKTSESALSQLFWGRTGEYEKETITEVEFSKEHSVTLSGLLPETEYHFQIMARDEKGNTAKTGDRTFRTLSPPDTVPPANVQNFVAEPGDGQVTLKWQNPPDADFQAVKIMRSPFFYPQDPFDGLPVYNADGEFFIDTDVENGKKYYYTAFAYDTSGNFSSGATAFAVPSAVPAPVPPPEIFPPALPVPPELEKLTLEDFEFWQKGQRLELIDGRRVRAEIGFPLTVALPYEKAPEVLKTIMITLEKRRRVAEQPQNLYAEQTQNEQGRTILPEAYASVEEELKNRKFFSFILHINESKTRYEATLMPPEEELLYPMFVTIMDFKHQIRKRLDGEMQTIAPPIIPPIPPKPWWGEPRNWRYFLYIILLLILLVYVLRRKRKKEIKKPPKQEAF